MLTYNVFCTIIQFFFIFRLLIFRLLLIIIRRRIIIRLRILRRLFLRLLCILRMIHLLWFIVIRLIIIIISILIILVIIRLRVDEGFQSGGTSIVICKADWCGHCKKAAPEFQKLASASPIALSNGKQATVKILDADQDKEEVKKYNVRGYPSILIVNGSDTTEYPGERTYDGVIEFLNQM